MHEVIVKYKDHKTLQMLKDIAKYFNFSVIASGKDKEPRRMEINGVTIISGDKTIDISELESIFSGKSIDPKQLRNESWLRKS